MNGEGLPYSENTERSLLGAMLLSRTVASEALQIIAPQDFYLPAHQAILAAVEALWRAGEAIDAVTVADALAAQGTLEMVGGPSTLIELQAETPATSSWKTYCRTLTSLAARRRLALLCEEFGSMAAGNDSTPEEIADLLEARLGEVFEGAIVEDPEGLSTLDEFLDRPMEARPPWIVPGLLRVGWRIVVVAPEGIGKTVLFRQIGIAAAQGIHPLHFGPIDTCRVLIVDLENPDDSIVDVCEPIRAKTRIATRDYDPERAWLYHRPEGINLRARRDRSELEAVVASVRPDLVCLGPIYKSYDVSASESDEIAAKEVMRVFDDLRTRYRFGLLLEHHAPKGVGKARVQTPYGTSLWLRWPEIGIGLNPVDPGNNAALRLERWRGDRLKNSWPLEIHRGREGSGSWMWNGVWPAGTFSGPGEPSVPTAEPVREAPAAVDPADLAF